MNKILLKHARLIFWFGFILSAVVLFFPAYGEGGIEYIDKIAHFMIFALLGLFAFISFKPRVIVFILLFLYMIVVEVIQELYIPGRGYDFFDIVAGMSGLFFVLPWINMRNFDKIKLE